MQQQLQLDPSKYTSRDLQKLFSLGPNYGPSDVKLAYQRLVKSQGHASEVKTFLAIAARRLVEEEDEGTWGAKRTQLMSETDRSVIVDPNFQAGLKSSISGGALAHTGEANPGWLNPLNIKTRTQTVHIDSRFRDKEKFISPYNFSLELPVAQEKVISIRVAFVCSSTTIPSQEGYVFLELKDGCKNNNSPFLAVSDVGSMSSDIITRIDNPNSGTTLGLEGVDFENYLEHQREFFGPVTVRKLELNLLDYKGNRLSYSRSDNDWWWSVSLIFTKLYD